MSQIDPLVNATWLLENLATSVLVDVRWSLAGGANKEAYLAGHLPGARFADLDHELSQLPASQLAGRHPLPTKMQFAMLLSRLGVDGQQPAVAYDDMGGAIAARFWWLMRYFGLDNGRVLDGGIQAWQSAGGSIETGAVAPARQTAPPLVEQPQMIVDADTLAALRNEPGVVLLDARSAARFRGDEEPVDARAGHIPGAQNAPFNGNLVAPRGTFLPRETLRQRFTALGTADARKVVNYCGSGVTACHNALAIQHAGLGDSLLYPGSWSDWASQRALPLATGEG